jgi:hypothetical protein
MAKAGYRVEYHVVGTIYLEPGEELSGTDFARLWSGMTVFGKRRVGGAFWQKGGPIPSKATRLEVGSLELVQPLLERGP